MKFTVEIKEERSIVHYQVNLISKDGQFEEWRAARNNYFLEVKTNRPMLRKKRLMSKRPDWKVLDTNISYANTKEAIVLAIIEKADSLGE